MSKDFTKEQKAEIWKQFFGPGVSSGVDPFGKTITIDNFTADHIYPFDKGGKTIYTNGMPLHKDSNTEKSDKMEGWINNKYFQVKGTPEAGKLDVDGVIYTYVG